jgi:hypothetical protein
MASLQELPVEIFDLILGHTSLSSRRALILTCKQLCEYVRPWLYHAVRLQVTDNVTSLFGFILSLLGHTKTRALFVHELSIQGSKPLTLPIPFAIDEMRRWVRYTEPSQFAKNRWSTHLLKGHTDAILAALLAGFDNLSTLRLGYDLWSDSQYLGAVLPRLRKLQHVEFGSDPEPTSLHDIPDIFRPVHSPISYDMTLLRNLLRLPKIESISCLAAEPKNGAVFIPPPTPCNSLTRLALKKSELKPSVLAKILAVTPQLRHLEYALWLDAGSPKNYFECTEMDIALQPVFSTLESLKIEIEFYVLCAMDFGWGYDWGIHDTMRSLAQFPCLARLEIPLVVLLSWDPTRDIALVDVLPRSLKSLSLTTGCLDHFECYMWENTMDIYSRLRAYVQSRDVHAPALEHLEVWINEVCYHGDPDYSAEFIEYVKLKKACCEAGITLGGDSDDIFDRLPAKEGN